MSAFAGLVLLLLFSSVAAAGLSGNASVTYSTYNGRANDAYAPGQSASRSSNSLVQNYSLLYAKAGVLYNSRVGSYNLDLGYNFTSLDTSFKSSGQQDESFNENRGHFLYNGSIRIDPKEVPFRLLVFSRDIGNNVVSNSAGTKQQRFGSMFGSINQATGINSGQHIESGATLTAGVKNGMTNGYNEVLRHLPMVLLDYRDTINRDLLSVNPVDDRLSRLAFVSLNKKDNWFHYRHTQYTDNINTNNNYEESEIQLGTVDQHMARRWIDFSNWIRISTDLLLSNRKSNSLAFPTQDISLKMFATAERTNWNGRSFTEFRRDVDGRRTISYLAAIPLYVSGVVSKALSWNTRASFRDSHDIDVNGVSSTFKNTLLGYRVNAFKLSPFALTQSLDVQSAASDTLDSLTFAGLLETTSTRYFSNTVTLGASYNIRHSSNSTGSDSSDFLDQTVSLHGGYVASNTLRFNVTQKNIFTKGKSVDFNGTTNNSQSELSQYSNSGALLQDRLGNESKQSFSSLNMSWTPKPRLTVDASLGESIVKNDQQASTSATSARLSVSFVNSVLDVRNKFVYMHSDIPTSGDYNYPIVNETFLKYVFSRNLSTNASASFMTTSFRARAYAASFSQGLSYSYFTNTGVNRKLFEINETASYSDGLGDSDMEASKAITLGLKYYPISRLSLAAGVGYSTISKNDSTLIWNASATANLALLQTSVDFVSGIRKIDNARENKLTGNVRKSF